MRSANFFVVIIGLTLFVASPVTAATIISTFDIDAEGWTTTGAAITHENTGGNPGGFLKIEDTRDDTFGTFPPSKFKGNLLAFDDGLLTYDLLLFSAPTTLPLTSVGSGLGRIQLVGGGSNATFDYAPNPPIPSTEFWKTYFVPMSASDWNTTQANWETVLSDVTLFSIILEPINGSVVGLDNFQLASAPIPEPSSLLLLGGGMLGLMRRRRKSTL